MSSGALLTPGPAKPCPGLSHSTISEKSSPCLGEGVILTHMVPDLARWQIRAGGVLLFGKMVGSDRPEVHQARVLDTSDRPNRPRCGSRAFQRLRKAAPLPHGFAIWQDRAPYASKWRPRLGMGSSFQKWCCGLGQGTFWPVQASKTPRRTRKRPEVLSEQGPKCSKSRQLAPRP